MDVPPKKKLGNQSRCFDNIGNSIMLQVAAEVDPWEPKDVSALGHDTKAARDERMKSLKEREGRIFCGGEHYIYTGRHRLVSFNQTTFLSIHQKLVC